MKTKNEILNYLKKNKFRDESKKDKYKCKTIIKTKIIKWTCDKKHSFDWRFIYQPYNWAIKDQTYLFFASLAFIFFIISIIWYIWR